MTASAKPIARLVDLRDVDPDFADGEVPVYDAATQTFSGGAGAGGGGGAPTGPAGGALSGTYPNPAFAADMATQAELDAHTADSTSVHGIADTADLILEGDARLTDDRDPTAHTHPQAEITGLAGALTDAKARANHTGTQTSATISDFTEAVQDAVAALLGEGSNITLTYDDASDTLTIEAAGSSTDPEAVRDAIGVALVGAGLIGIAVNDGADTITISTTATANSTDAQLRDRATHTGAQAIATVTGLQAALDALVPATRTVGPGTGLTGGGDLSANRTLAADFGTGAGKVTEGNDARLSDTRTPTDGSVTSAKLANDLALPGNPTAATQAQGNNTTRLATTAYVQTEAGLLIPRSVVDAPGDLLIGSADNTVTRLPAPTSSGDVLTADTGEALKMKWAAPAGGSGGPTIEMLGADVANAEAVALTYADITGLSFAVAASTRYRFRFVIDYTAAAATTGSKWSINGPAATRLIYRMHFTSGVGSDEIFHSSAYNEPSSSAASTGSAAGANLAVIEGIVLIGGAGGTIVARFASEISGSAITAKAGSFVEYQELA